MSGRLRCGVCGRPYTGQGAKSGQFAYYICGTLYREGGGACDARYRLAGGHGNLLVADVFPADAREAPVCAVGLS